MEAKEDCRVGGSRREMPQATVHIATKQTLNRPEEPCGGNRKCGILEEGC
jgi:hypothetical protein